MRCVTGGVDVIPESDYIFWGTGRIAKGFYKKYCKERGILRKPLLWCDNNPSLQGSNLDGVPVVSSEEVAKLSEEYYQGSRPLAIVIGATGINLLQIVSQLEQMAVKARLYSAVQLDAQVYFTEEAEDVDSVLSMLSDEKSKTLYRSMLENMKLGRCIDFSLAASNQYFGNDVIPSLSEDEIIVDAGVCQGEEIDKALAMAPGITVHAFEPDGESYRLLQKKYRQRENVILHGEALWHCQERMGFSSGFLPSASRISEEMNSSEDEAQGIQCVPLDDILQGSRVTLIKMDIEGAEYNALQGAEQTIKKWHPKLAICVYHNLEDYIRIPLLLRSMAPSYRFYFRQHSVTSGESVLYAIR